MEASSSTAVYNRLRSACGFSNMDLSAVTWRKSSYSNTDGGECVEVCAHIRAPAVPVRDSKTPNAPALVLRAAAWSSFVTAVRRDELPAC